MKIFIDNGHGQFTPGKRSPDGQLREVFFNREIVSTKKEIRSGPAANVSSSSGRNSLIK